MQLHNRIELLTTLGQRLKALDDPPLSDVIHKAYLNNTWFAKDQIRKSLEAIRDEFLDQEKLKAWTKPYQISDNLSGKTIGICLLYTSPSPRDKRQSRMPSSA